MATPAKRARPYRDFLTPALHRKFTSASLLALGVCYADAIWIGEWDIFWQWFPLGFTGIRTLLLFIPALLIFILRVSRTHVGTITTTSPFETFRQEIFSVGTYLTFIWYMISAFMFSEVYLFSQPADAKLGMVNHGLPHERPRLNERAVYFRTMMLLLGIVQCTSHLFRDLDLAQYPLRKIRASTRPDLSGKDAKGEPSATVEPPVAQLKKALPSIFRASIMGALLFSILSVFVYYLTPIRGLAWNISFNILRWIHHIPSKQKSQKTGIAPAVDLIARLTTETFLLNFLWDFANAAFGAYISQEPLKKGKPLTDDGKDPNGSLIVGLKAKKEFAKATAFWELVLITTRFPARRQTIYSELDRAAGSTWSQIKIICLDEISAIKSRIEAFQLASAPPAPVSDADIPGRQPIAAPLKTDNVFAPAPAPATEGQKVAAYARSVALKHGMSPGAKPLQNAIEYSGRKLLTDGQRAQIQPAVVKKKAEGWVVQLVKSPVGWPFRQPFARRVMSVICGTPYSRAGVIIDAVDALTRLAVESLREDTYGKVSKDVAGIIRVFADTITAIEAFVAGMEPHWTDVEFSNKKRGSVKEVNEILDTLRDGLSAILGAYGEYLGGLGMEAKELKAIKVLVGKRKEMEEVVKA